ncbi:BhlA/UviB family holin-like peptide [Sporosarcina luteola]|uniref:BhlA/UviB family holin-like peptide n=1 Tax=Sporosarcina luteola TaxID=582850 RepID=UPI0020408A1F|nr:BhlA/UviB family holin-like peptide [Sporosarcina luteola]MCM3744745.1 BhlA/UviB family holin-like peptide [Sporosarcina luteola]
MATKELLSYFLTQGPFAVLFVWLFWYQVKSSESREKRNQFLLEAMAHKYDEIVEELRDVKERLPRE